MNENISLGKDCIIYPNVTIYKGCKIGNRELYMQAVLSVQTALALLQMDKMDMTKSLK